MPANTPPAGTSGRTWIGAYFITASSLLTQWGGTLFTDGTGTLSSAHCAALEAQGRVDDPCVPGSRQPRKTGSGPHGRVSQKWAVTGGTWGCTGDHNHRCTNRGPPAASRTMHITQQAGHIPATTGKTASACGRGPSVSSSYLPR